MKWENKLNNWGSKIYTNPQDVTGENLESQDVTGDMLESLLQKLTSGTPKK